MAECGKSAENQEGERSFAEITKMDCFHTKQNIDIIKTKQNGRYCVTILPKSSQEISPSRKRIINNICNGHLVVQKIGNEEYVLSLAEYLSTSLAPKKSLLKQPSQPSTSVGASTSSQSLESVNRTASSDPSNLNLKSDDKEKSKGDETLYMPLKLTLSLHEGVIEYQTLPDYIEAAGELLKEKLGQITDELTEKGHREPYLANATLFMKAGGQLTEFSLPEDSKTICVFVNQDNHKDYSSQLDDVITKLEKIVQQNKGILQRVHNKPGLWGYVRFRSEQDTTTALNELDSRCSLLFAFKKPTLDKPKRSYEFTLTRYLKSADNYHWRFYLKGYDAKVITNELIDVGSKVFLNKSKLDSHITATVVGSGLTENAINDVVELLRRKYDLKVHHVQKTFAKGHNGKFSLKFNILDFIRHVCGKSFPYSMKKGKNGITYDDVVTISVALEDPEDIAKLEKGIITDSKLLQGSTKSKGIVTHKINISHTVVVRRTIFAAIVGGIDFLKQTLLDKYGEAISLTTEKKKNGDVKVILSCDHKMKKILNPAIRVLANITTPLTIKSTKDHRLCMESPLGQAVIRSIERAHCVKIHFEGTRVMIYGSPVQKQNGSKDLRSMIEDCMKNSLVVDLLQYGEGPVIISQLQNKFGYHLDGLSRWIGCPLAVDIMTAQIHVNGLNARKQVIRIVNDLNFKESDIRRDQSDEGLMCSACFSTPEWPFVKLGICGHVYCWECLEGQISAAISDRDFPIRCAAAECDCAVPWQDLKLTLRDKKDVFHKLLEASLDLYISANKDAVQFCPTSGCSMFYYSGVHRDSTKTKCPSCSVELCTACNTIAHPGTACAQNRRNALDFPPDLKEWMNDDGALRKLCPRCTHPIEKNGGCPNVVCRACKAQLCWDHNLAFKDFDGFREHFKTHFD